MEGFEVPIHRSLTQTIMIAGVPRELAILNGTISAALILGMHSLMGIPLGILLHLISVAISRKDPQFLSTFRRHIRHKSYYGV